MISTSPSPSRVRRTIKSRMDAASGVRSDWAVDWNDDAAGLRDVLFMCCSFAVGDR